MYICGIYISTRNLEVAHQSRKRNSRGAAALPI